MITKFSALYVGHIELENVGKDGTPADQRRYPNEDVRGRVAEIERENGLADPVLHTGQTLRLRSP